MVNIQLLGEGVIPRLGFSRTNSVRDFFWMTLYIVRSLIYILCKVSNEKFPNLKWNASKATIVTVVVAVKK